MSVLAGLVGSGINVYGHSVVQLTLNDQTVMVDLTGAETAATSLQELPTVDAYIQHQSFDEMLRYDHTETTLNVKAEGLRHFSTSSSMEDELELQYKAVFGQDSSFKSVTSTNDGAYNIDSYDSLIKKVIGLEMVRLIESNSPDMAGVNFVLATDLYDFEYIHGYQPSASLDFEDADIIQINKQLLKAYKSNGVVDERLFDFLGAPTKQAQLVNDLKSKEYIKMELDHQFYVASDYFDTTKSTGNNQDIFKKLIDIGFISTSGLIDMDALNDASKIDQLKSFYTFDQAPVSVVDDLFNFLKARSYVYNDVVTSASSDPFESALNRFEALSEELFHGLTSSTTPIYAAPKINGKKLFSLSEFVVGGYEQGAKNSMFIRMDHQKLQQKMSMFFSSEYNFCIYDHCI